ncbi:MAG: tRNA 2-thiouridine(34) synthase MnmA [bacterium]
MNKPKVLMAMSGGVDSSVSAALLVEQGFDVIGAYMHNWTGCESDNDRRDATRVAAQLGIDLLTFDFESEYRRNVFEYMVQEYKAGRTPNPDVLCNKYMKFGFLLREAEKLGCSMIATGHYARVRRNDDGTAHLLAGRDAGKDQSYFLCQLTQGQLKRVMFPIGDMEKSDVRVKARELNIVVADKKDSQGLCFVGKIELSEFLKTSIPPREGNIVDIEGRVLGTHKGHAYYTIGQRQGLGIGGGDPYFVVERRPDTDEVVVAHEDDPKLYSSEIIVTDLTETVPGNLNTYFNKPIQARIRYRQPLQGCVVKREHPVASSQHPIAQAKVTFDKPQRAVAPGQFVAFYVDDELVGSGVIASA